MPYEIVGDDYLGYSEIVGQEARPATANQRIAPFPGQPAGGMLRVRAPTKAREYPLGFDSGAGGIAAGATASVTAQPQVTFRCDRLVIAGSIAASFLINDIKVGQASQLISSGPVPAEVFGQGAFGVRLKMDTAQVSMLVSINVTNLSGAAARFLAAMIGPAIQ